MNTLPITITKNSKGNKSTFTMKFDSDRFERVAAALGMVSKECLASIAQSEKEIKAGKTRKIKSLRELR
jgi:hypothetical protein